MKRPVHGTGVDRPCILRRDALRDRVRPGYSSAMGKTGWLVGSVAALCFVLGGWRASQVHAAQTATPSPEDVAGGMRIFRTKADCQSCHGWAADGRKMDSQMPDGANLRVT